MKKLNNIKPIMQKVVAIATIGFGEKYAETSKLSNKCAYGILFGLNDKKITAMNI